jgi:hypothetical protein
MALLIATKKRSHRLATVSGPEKDAILAGKLV